ncbi:hypothetical protein UlMin_003199 [Ulmus minor]
MKQSKPFSVLFLILFFSSVCLSYSSDTIKPGEILHSNETLISSNGMFELGFFSSDDSSNEYLGIWFKNDTNKKAVWIANREEPLVDSSGFLSFNSQGNLVVNDVRTKPIPVNVGEGATSNDTRAKLLDSGNFLLLQGEETIWESFSYPTDTFLPGMKLGVFNIGKEKRKQFIVSWLSLSDPSGGSFSLGLNVGNMTQLQVWREDQAYLSIGYWDGKSFRFVLESYSSNYNFSYVSNSHETYITFSNKASNVVSWFVMAQDGMLNEYRLENQEISAVNHSLCDEKLQRNSSYCLVLQPCEGGDDFWEIRGLMPSSSMVVSRETRRGLSDCELMCRSNCSCVAYASKNDDRARCQLYYGTKNDLLQTMGKGNQTIFSRGPAIPGEFF